MPLDDFDDLADILSGNLARSNLCNVMRDAERTEAPVDERWLRYWRPIARKIYEDLRQRNHSLLRA